LLHRAVDRPDDDLAVLGQVRVGAVPHPDAVDELKGNTPMAFTGYQSRYLESVAGASSRPE
jgi:hypothetical protein